MKKSFITHKQIIFFCAQLCLLPSCTHKKDIDRQNIHIYQEKKSNNIHSHVDITSENSESATVQDHGASHKKPPPITIWIHGTLIFRKAIFQNAFKNGSSLVAAMQLEETDYFRLIAESISQSDPKHFPLDTFYVFGWSGKLRAYEREIAAKKLYENLLAVITDYEEKYHRYPVIRIIAHSHGGNVALNMAHITHAAERLHIKSLILLACPVQEKTMNLINEPIFNRVYSLYSSFDFVQVIAPEFFRHHDHKVKNKRRRCKIPPFSSRRFPMQQHLTQTKIKINSFAPVHTTFATQEFVGMLPTILYKLDDWHEQAHNTQTHHKQKLLCIYTHHASKKTRKKPSLKT